MLQIDASSYTHLHFGFNTLIPDFQVQTGDILTSCEIENFKCFQGSAKIFSLVGWAFSTDPGTYIFFRNGVLTAHQKTLATSIDL